MKIGARFATILLTTRRRQLFAKCSVSGGEQPRQVHILAKAPAVSGWMTLIALEMNKVFSTVITEDGVSMIVNITRMRASYAKE